jgi:sterol desaturase/sphingolipid hydroxylase (fatty acid hydroxylase superfamily)
VTRFDALGGAAVGLALAALFLVETCAPLRGRVRPRAERLATNALVALGAALVVRLALVPVGVVVAGAAERAGVGLLHWLPVPAGLAWPAGLLLLDYTMYVWHRLNHRVPLLWRFHVVHHTDLDLDVSTALRFHAGELLLSCGWRAAQVAVIGPPVALVLVFEVVFDTAPRSTTATGGCRTRSTARWRRWWSRRECTASITRPGRPRRTATGRC